jgi:cystathionine gamma-synthase
METTQRLSMKFETLAVHAGAERDETGSIAPPLHLSTNYEHSPSGEPSNGHLYIRMDNPIQRRLEDALAAVESGQGALVFASGVAAGAAYLQSLPPGSHVLFSDDLFYGFRAMAPRFLPRWGIEWSEVDMTDLIAVRAALRPETRVVWAEMPTNPLMKIMNIAGLAEIAHAAGAQLLVDSTFPTPALLRPLSMGADVTLHSTTKYLGGHSDVQGGALVFARCDDQFARITDIRKLLGGVAAPFGSWLVLRGLRTLAARMRVHSANAAAVAAFLELHPEVAEVLYPGLASNAGYSLAKEQMDGFGGMLSFRVKGGRTGAIEVASRVRLFINAGSLGGSESLIQHAASVMHPANTIPDDLLRVSVGLEHPADLMDDLKQALDQ